MLSNEIIISQALKSDLPDILAIQKAAFLLQAEIYDYNKLPPLVESLRELEKDMKNKVILKAILENEVVGSVRGYEENGICHIGRLSVHPSYMGKGIGSQLMEAIEDLFSHHGHYRLFTGHKSERNLYLYKKLGYEVTHSEQIKKSHGPAQMIFMEKRIKVSE